ncbi:flagellar biosynthesis protein FlhA [Trinickia acidisoli]|uniref:flagellar biosynthesis protein FlhA n=1 Tax=Trinickia acidisoli TaxID=2767482 RepID=UPI001A8D9E26|nr:flagellar biosynthesis protein FlhA [Trinickia acidisoli]
MIDISSAMASSPFLWLRNAVNGRLARWLMSAGARADTVAAVLIALVMAMMILPLPTLVIDALIGVNIGAAILLIALALYLPSAVSFSSFPVVLLLTTLFRLGIEVGTSRSILLRADAGEIVDTFGRFVAGDNLVVGLIVFSVIAIVQFLVVTKGAERVAEVAARFTLDAIPGKQMAIDADLRAGFTRPEMAQHLRAELARESRMHGAMDGAMRFVKGDAIAGLVIVVVNLTAGIAIGVAQRGLSFEQALERYSILTIGNALIAQIPALLIAIAAAILITRGADAAERGSTVGAQIAGQLRGAPAAWLMAACLMAIFAAMPGMPWLVFLTVGGSMLAVAVSGLREQARAQARSQAMAQTPTLDVVPDDADVRQIVPMRAIVVSLSSREASDGATERADQVAALTRTVRRVRNEIVLRYGVTVPVVELDRVDRLDLDSYEISIHEVIVASGRFHWDRVCITVASDIEAVAAEHGAAQSFPLIEGAVWIDPQRLARPDDEAGLDAHGYFALLLRRLLHRHARRFVGIHEAQLVFNWLQREMPATAKELSQALTLPRFAEVMKLLVSERVSLRNVREIAETLVLWAPREKEAATLADHVRVALGAQICQEFSADAVLHVWLIERALETQLSAALQQTPLGAILATGHDVAQEIVRRIRALNAMRAAGAVVPVVLTTHALRRPLRQLLADDLFETHVLSYAELPSTQRVRVQGSIALDARTGDMARLDAKADVARQDECP